jgi:hypothetical protein
VLQHFELPLQTVCQLLCVSRATAAIVHARCEGKYKMTCSRNTLEGHGLSSWIPGMQCWRAVSSTRPLLTLGKGTPTLLRMKQHLSSWQQH